MNVREAILKAADFIEVRPEAWSYYVCAVPECGTVGCALGWIGHFAGMKGDVGSVAAAMGLEIDHSGFREWTFYNRIQAIVGGPPLNKCSAESPEYFLAHASVDEVARVLRLYADKYHPAPKMEHVGIPESVRAIFTETIEERT